MFSVLILVESKTSEKRYPDNFPRVKLPHAQGQGLGQVQGQFQGCGAIFLGGNCPRTLKKYSRFKLKMPNCGAVAVLLTQVHPLQNEKLFVMEEPSISLQNVKKPTEECSFLRSYLVAACSLAKNKTPSQVIFHGLQYDQWFLKPSTDKYDLRRQYSI